MVDGRVGLHLLDAQLVRQGGHLLLSQGGLQVLRHRSGHHMGEISQGVQSMNMVSYF